MKIPVKLAEFQINIGQQIEKELSSAGYPPCLGCMYPPIIENEPHLEITDVFVEPGSVDPLNVMKIASESVVPKLHVDKVHNTVISKDSYNNVVNYSNQVAAHYTKSVIACAECRYATVCFQLTTNYLKLIKIKY